MSTLIFSLPQLYNSYKAWVSKNPSSLGDWEQSAKWISYIVAGRINNSHVVSELIYCLSNLLVLFNDNIIKKAGALHINDSIEKIKLYLTVVEYSEVFFELSAKKLWGATGKWLVIVSIQIFKCISRLILIHHFKEPIIKSPSVPLLDRKKLQNAGPTTVGDIVAANQLENVTFTLKRSGRVVRKVESSPPLYMRTWKPIGQNSTASCENHQESDKSVVTKQRIAETIYIVKPIVHLLSMRYFDTTSWKQWMIPLAFDVTSLQLYHYSQRKHFRELDPQQRLQVSKRTILLLLYLIRSPVYEKYSKNKINALLLALSNLIPLAHIICKPMQEYVPFWQSTYFYMWSS